MIMAGSVNPRWFRAPATNFIDVRPGDMGDSLVPNGLSIVCNVFCSRSINPRSWCIKLTSQMPSWTSLMPARPVGTPHCEFVTPNRAALLSESMGRWQKVEGGDREDQICVFSYSGPQHIVIFAEMGLGQGSVVDAISCHHIVRRP